MAFSQWGGRQLSFLNDWTRRPILLISDLLEYFCKALFSLKAWRQSIPTCSFRTRPNSWSKPMYLGVNVQNWSYKQSNAISLSRDKTGFQ